MAARIEFQIVNGAEFSLVTQNLIKFARDVPLAVDDEFAAFMEDRRKKTSQRPYAAKLPSQTYIRTFRFARSWRHVPLGRGIRMLQNNASFRGTFYGSYVVAKGDGTGQARIHQGRWWIARDKFAKELELLAPRIERKFKRIARQGGVA